MKTLQEILDETEAHSERQPNGKVFVYKPAHPWPDISKFENLKDYKITKSEHYHLELSPL